jgi:hypothetical protein
LGLPRIGVATETLAALATGAWMVDASRSTSVGLWALDASSRWASGFLMGAALTAMLLGHYYLIAPTMTIEPLKRTVTLIAVGLAVRCAPAGLAVWGARAAGFDSAGGRLPADAMLLIARWGIGFAGAALSVYLARRTVAIRATQSATGILYITTIFVLFGELTSMIAGP